MVVPAASREWPIQCQICLEDVTELGREDRAAATCYNEQFNKTCAHVFHEHCIARWLRDTDHAPNCPSCRAGPFNSIKIIHDESIMRIREAPNPRPRYEPPPPHPLLWGRHLDPLPYPQLERLFDPLMHPRFELLIDETHLRTQLERHFDEHRLHFHERLHERLLVQHFHVERQASMTVAAFITVFVLRFFDISMWIALFAGLFIGVVSDFILC